MGLAELYYATGESDYRDAFEWLWWSMLKGDRHNNGGFTSGEKATGNPYHPGAIETCCTVAWMAMSVEMLRLTGESVVADELELSMLNSGLGMMNPIGRWVTYNTPMDGMREASAHTIVFQARAGQPELNCCSVNGPRALGLLCEWAAMKRADGGIAVNYYGPGVVTVPLESGNTVKLCQDTQYPDEARVRLIVHPEKRAKFAIALRIPYWSEKTSLRSSGEPERTVPPGRYAVLDRTWQPGDEVEMTMDFRPRFWFHRDRPGEGEFSGARSAGKGGAGFASVYRGPILLAFDPRLGPYDLDDLPCLDPNALRLTRVGSDSWLKPWLLYEAAGGTGAPVRLCDFASAGAAGNSYRSWLPVTAVPERMARFSRRNPLRSIRV
jgi:hypothetical protein